MDTVDEKGDDFEIFDDDEQYLKALAGIIFMACQVDGNLSPKEFKSSIAFLLAFDLISFEQYQMIFELLRIVLGEYRNDNSTWIEWINVIPREKRKDAFKAAVMAIMSDRNVHRSEAEFIDSLAKAFSIDEEYSKEVTKAVSILMGQANEVELIETELKK